MAPETEISLQLADEAATRAFAGQLALAIVASGMMPVIFLHGTLGAGKTAFVRGFLRALGVRQHVKSPTYSLVESFQTQAGPVHHFDFYRVNDPAELEYMGIQDYCAQSAILLVEWPSCGQGFLPPPDLDCYIDFVACTETARHLRVKASSVSGEKLLQERGLAWQEKFF